MRSNSISLLFRYNLKGSCIKRGLFLFISARRSAPNDGTDPFTNTTGQQAFARSKQNSDATGMFYQWGRKDPFTFATSSLYNDSGGNGPYGKYPVKVYNCKRELIYQKDNGGDNADKTPVGGVIVQSTPLANSMMETIKNPNLFYGYWSAVISQVGHSKELWDYYWTSYSRGIDGHSSWNLSVINKPKWHNTYLDGYIVLRSKSIYDPCPYGYRTVTNGTYNDFKSNPRWAQYSYTGGVVWLENWLVAMGSRNLQYSFLGRIFCYRMATKSAVSSAYVPEVFGDGPILLFYPSSESFGTSVRCIEDATGSYQINNWIKTAY